MKVFITGAHFTPALAVIEALQKNDTDKKIDITYVGRKTTREGDPSPSAESQILPAMGVRFIPIVAGRIQRRFTRYTIPSLLKIPVGMIQAFYLMVKHHPDVVVSFGGYLAFPLVFSAWLLSIPVIVHEQTLVTGLANKVSSVFADKIAISFQDHPWSEKPNVFFTGNPLRKAILTPEKLPADLQLFVRNARTGNQKIILITGGNQGSHSINEAVDEALPELLKKYAVIHQTGDSAFKDYEKLTEKNNNIKNYIVYKFIGNEFGSIVKEVDLVVTRAGINTLLELAFAQKPALIIPLPFVTGDEQTKNARFFEKLGMATVLLQSQLSAQHLKEKIDAMTTQPFDFSKSDQIVVKDAAQRLALEIILLLKRTQV